MTTAFIVTSGEYSDYRIKGVFSTKEKAEQFKLLYDYDDIEEWDLDPEVPVLPEGVYPWHVDMKRDGDCIVYRTGPDSLGEGLRTNWFLSTWEPYRLIVDCLAPDKEGAAKIANEIRARLIATDKWGKDE
jgi:hypothetical protein